MTSSDRTNLPTLNTTNHDRDSAGMTYVYPVVSRRAGGVSVGINLNPNAACNWQCIYCQVPNLVRGDAPEIDHALLSDELDHLLQDIVHGDFLERRAPPEARVLKDIALSGNGEPTTCSTFDKVIDIVASKLDAFALRGKINLVVITNGSLIFKPQVRAGLAHLGQLGGEIWFKFDAATDARRTQINHAAQSTRHALHQIEIASELAHTRLQTCIFTLDGQPMPESEVEAYLKAIEELRARNIVLQGITLYGLARPSMQPEAARLDKIDPQWAEAFAKRIRQIGYDVAVHL